MSSQIRNTKTKQKLTDALTSLLSQHALSEISVIDLVSKAKVNRSTFYLHYKSLDEFLDEIESDLYLSLEEKMLQFFSNTSWLGYVNKPNHHENLPILEFILNEISNNILLVAFIKHRKNNSEFLIRLVDTGYQNASKSILQVNPDIEVEKFKYYYSFISMGFLGLIFTWIENDLKQPPEQISQMLHSLIYSNINFLNN